jgi:hypothetical protein
MDARFLPILAGIAEYYQPTFPGMARQNKNSNPVEFERWLAPTLDLAYKLAQFESPRFTAVAVTMPSMENVQQPAAQIIEIDNDPVALQLRYQRMLRIASK